ncbi:hypothetical protein [Longimicrobium sp.]|uniref:hypothetical protein n=1 Tax=Longimicrobium sp. TaxID=2029185 RepID=UPI002C3D0CD7|nr:hypothetical protein [Longimicrobium sp.]HSU13395.1 hypothetical protein [Longimicrobium sp.]
MSEISPEFGRRIQQRIDALDTADPRAWPVRVCKEEMNALPLHGNQIYLWALRPDGVVLCLDHESASHHVEEERDPLTLFAVLVQGAKKYPELRQIVPPPPPGTQQCEACGGTGSGENWKPPAWDCLRCGGLGWSKNLLARPATDWLARIDRGDQLELRAQPDAARLEAGRLAGYYVISAGDACWSSPAGPAARQELIGRLVDWERGKVVTPEWQSNPTACADPFDSLEHVLTFSGSGSNGTWEEEFARQPDGSCVITLTLNNDFDPAGPAFPVRSAREVDADAARVEIERTMRASGRYGPFPAIVPREPAD